MSKVITYCDFRRINADAVQCQRCFTILLTKHNPELCVARCRLPSETATPPKKQSSCSTCQIPPASFPESQPILTEPLQGNMPTFCEYGEIQGVSLDEIGRLRRRCIHCGYVTEPHFQRERPAPRECSEPNHQKVNLPLPNYLARGVHFIQEWARHRANGRPLLRFDQILQRYRLCSSCPYYNDLEGACTICGCYVNLLHSGQGVNRLEWGDSFCPLPEPRWTAEEPKSLGDEPVDK